MFIKKALVRAVLVLSTTAHLESMQDEKILPASFSDTIKELFGNRFVFLPDHVKTMVLSLVRSCALQRALEILRESFPDVTSETPGEMLIMLAVACNNQKALSLLMQASLDDDKPTLYGETILHTYALKGDTAMVRQLVASGIDGESTNCYGETPFYCSVSKRGC